MAGVTHSSEHLTNSLTDVCHRSTDAADAFVGARILLLAPRELDGGVGRVHQLGHGGPGIANDYTGNNRWDEELDKGFVFC